MDYNKRILGRMVAHEMSAAEVEKVSGARWYGTNHRVSATYPAPNSPEPVEYDSYDGDQIWD